MYDLGGQMTMDLRALCHDAFVAVLCCLWNVSAGIYLSGVA